MIRVAIAGGSGYVGGELLRLALGHPELEVTQITSERLAGRFVSQTHPNLRGHTELKFQSLDTLEPVDLLFLALPHKSAAKQIERFAGLAERIIDCSADFRLSDGAAYERWYGEQHPAPQWLDRFVYGLPEKNRAQLEGARYASGVGCNATAVNLALLPMLAAGKLDTSRGIICDIKVGSSEGGASSNAGSHHPERAGVVRSFAPTGHRHTAEVEALTGLSNVGLSVTSVELVRGALATCHAYLREPLEDRDVWRVYRAATAEEPFLRAVHERTGIHRHPEPKLLCGTNWADIGWALDPGSDRIVLLGAIDNLVKGAAGSAMQCLNLMCGFDERTALGFAGLHPL